MYKQKQDSKLRGNGFTAMLQCSYCGRENDNAAAFCCECGSSLSELPSQNPLVTPYRAAKEIQQSIWEHFAVKRRQLYVAGFLIGTFGALIGVLHCAERGFPIWALPAGGVLGVAAVWLLKFTERLHAQLNQARAEGNPTGAQQVLFVTIGLVALVFVASIVAVLIALFI